jgi:hypothetical protein
MKRNCINVDQLESLVYVHYNLRLLSHFCKAMKNDGTYLTWDNNPKEANLEDGAIVLECLEAKLLGDHDGDHIHGANMPPPSTSKFSNARVFPLSLQHLMLCRDHVATRSVPLTLSPTPAPLLHRSFFWQGESLLDTRYLFLFTI